MTNPTSPSANALSATPRTDALTEDERNGYATALALARQLERELAAMTRQNLALLDNPSHVATSGARVLDTITVCKECPHHRYNTANMYECDKVRRTFDTPGKQTAIPSWCPLPHYPSNPPTGERSVAQEFVWLVEISGDGSTVYYTGASYPSGMWTTKPDGAVRYPSREAAEHAVTMSHLYMSEVNGGYTKRPVAVEHGFIYASSTQGTSDSDEAIRADFDAWGTRMNLNMKRKGDGYAGPYADWCWQAFYAGRRTSTSTQALFDPSIVARAKEAVSYAEKWKNQPGAGEYVVGQPALDFARAIVSATALKGKP